MPSPVTDAQKRLNTAQDAARRAKMGPPLNLRDTALDALADVGDEDAPAAEALWRAANPELADLLDAGPAD